MFLQLQAPEVIKNQKYTEKADVYSFAIILYELQTRKLPYENEQVWNVPKLVEKNDRPSFPADSNPDIAKLAKSCWKTK